MLVKKLKLDEGRLPQVYAHRHQGAVGGAEGSHEPGLGHPHDGLPAADGRVRRRVHLRRCRTASSSVGFVSGLDYRDPMFDPHLTFQRFKQHPFVARLLAGGKMVRYGAKALPEGGWHTVPRVHFDGGLIAGDAGGFMNSMRLKGIHLAMRTGMLAAETAFDAVRAGDVTASKLVARTRQRIDASAVKREMYPVRNVHQAFGHGLLAGLMYSGLSLVTGGWWFRDPMPSHAGHERIAQAGRLLRRHSRRSPDQPVDAGEDRSQLTFDESTERALLGHASPRRSAVASDRAQHRHLPHAMPRRVRQSVHALLSGERLRDGGRRAGRRRSCTSTRRTACTARRATSWTRTRSSTGCRPKAGKARSTKACDALARASAFKAAAIAAIGDADRRGARRRPTTGANRGARASATTSTRDGRQPILALWHGRILAATLYFRDRGIVAMTSENFDGEWVARLMRRFGYAAARGSTSRGGARALVQLRREMDGGQSGGVHRRRSARSGARGAARRGVARQRDRQSDRAVSHRGVVVLDASKSWDRHQVPKPGSHVGDRDRRADRRAAERGRRRRSRRDARAHRTRARGSRGPGAARSSTRATRGHALDDC